MLYYTDKIEQINPEVFLPYLSQARFEYQSRYRFQIDRVQSVLAFVLLRVGLAQEYGIFSMPRLGKSQTGKPFLLDHPDIYFNLSHCKKGVACGISREPIGVDIQDYVPFEEGIARQFMTNGEIDRAKRDHTDREFTRIWTLKESYGKHSGSGICYELTQVAAAEGIRSDGTISKCLLLNEFALSVTCGEDLKTIKLSADEILGKCGRLS